MNDQTIYNPSEHIIARLHLLFLIVPMFAWAIDRDFLGFFILNPLAFFILGLVVLMKKKVFVPSNTLSYFLLINVHAKIYGIILATLGLTSIIFFNIFYNFVTHNIIFVWIQLIISACAAMYLSAMYGEKLIMGMPPRF